MIKHISMKEFIEQGKRNKALQHLIPNGFGPGLPILSIQNKQLCVILPFFRTIKQLEKDKTLVFPVTYTITYLWPSGRIVAYDNLKMKQEFQKIDFGRAVGLFRHDAIKHLNYGEYEAKKEELFLLYDDMITSIYDHTKFIEEKENNFKTQLNMLLEPSLRPFYEAINKPFYEKFIK